MGAACSDCLMSRGRHYDPSQEEQFESSINEISVKEREGTSFRSASCQPDQLRVKGITATRFALLPPSPSVSVAERRVHESSRSHYPNRWNARQPYASACTLIPSSLVSKSLAAFTHQPLRSDLHAAHAAPALCLHACPLRRR